MLFKLTIARSFETINHQKKTQRINATWKSHLIRWNLRRNNFVLIFEWSAMYFGCQERWRWNTILFVGLDMHNSLLEVCQFECCRFLSDAFSMSYSAKDDTNGITARNETFSRLRNVRMKLCLISCRNHHRCQAHTHIHTHSFSSNWQSMVNILPWLAHLCHWTKPANIVTAVHLCIKPFINLTAVWKQSKRRTSRMEKRWGISCER